MSIIQQIRERGAVAVIILIALSLIGFILMDSGRGGAGGMVSPSDAIATVNGSKISYERFLDQSQQFEQYYQMQGRPVDDMTRQEIYTQAYQNLVDGELVTQELEKLGLMVTEKEFDNILYGENPAEFLRREFTDPATGAFDAAKARQAMAQLKRSNNAENKAMIENMYLQPLMENSVRNKYFSLIQNSVYVPKWLLEKTLADNSSAANMQYVMVPYTSIADSAVQVTDADIIAYAGKRKSEYETKDKTRSIAYVAFNFSANAQDTAAILAELNGLKAEFATTPDPGGFVNINGSTLSFFDGYNQSSKIQIAQKDSILATGLNAVYGPYADGNNFVLSRVVDVKTLADSVKARHILVSFADPQTQQPKLDDAAAKAKADSIEGLIKGGADFDALARQLSDDVGSRELGGDLGYFSSGTMVPEFNDFCFSGKTGDMGIVRTQFGYHLIQIRDQKNFGPAYKVAYLAREIEPSAETINDAMNAANVFASKANNFKSFEKTVSEDKLNKLLAPDVAENAYQIPGLGSNRNLVKEIFKADVGDVLEPVQLDNQFVVVAVTAEQKAGMPSAAKLRPLVESMVRNEKKGALLAGRFGKPTSLEELATKEKTQVQRADSISMGTPVIGGAGFEPKVGGYAVGKNNLNKVSEPIVGVNGVYVVKPEAQYAVANASQTAESIKTQFIQQQRNSFMYASLQALRQAADLTDKRSKFL